MVTQQEGLKIFEAAGRKGGQVPSLMQKTKFKKRLARNGRLKKRLTIINKKLKALEQNQKKEQMVRKQLRTEYRKLRALS